MAQIEQHLTTPVAREFFSEQVRGTSAPDRLGVNLPAWLNAAALEQLLLPSNDKAKPMLVGTKPWSGHPNQYIAIVCTGAAGPLYPGVPRCASDDAVNPMPIQVYLGVIAWRNGGAQLIARGGPFDCAMRWNSSGLPRVPMAAQDDAGNPRSTPIVPSSFVGFDSSSFPIGLRTSAFGLVSSWSEMYSDGGAYFTSLNLYAVEGDRVRQVLSAPMSAYSDVAGDWNKDQTRNHTITDAANTLAISAQRVHGFNDIIIANAKTCWKHVYRWSSANHEYQLTEL